MTKSNKKIVKNYFILALIFLAVILLVWYICKWYTVCNDYKKEIPVIRGTLNYEITESDFEHYILENPSSVVYMCTASEEKCRDFERDFKKIVVAKNLQDSIIMPPNSFFDNVKNKELCEQYYQEYKRILSNKKQY